jgi:hypothetical protein
LAAAELDSLDEGSLPVGLALVEVSEPVVAVLEEDVAVALEALVEAAVDVACSAAAFFAVAAFFAAAFFAAFAAVCFAAAVCATEAPAELVFAAVALLFTDRAGSCPEASCT